MRDFVTQESQFFGTNDVRFVNGGPVFLRCVKEIGQIVFVIFLTPSKHGDVISIGESAH